MSSDTRPISPHSFAQAIEDLPVENLYTKAFEINNSVLHLEQSNKTLQEYSDSIKNDESLDAESRQYGDKDCLEAIRENEVVIERQQERVRLLKAEVERRGQRWHEAEPKEKEGSNGRSEQPTAPSSGNAAASDVQVPARLTDEEIRRQMELRLAQDAGDEEGMHL